MKIPPITAHQQMIYDAWLKNDQQFKKAAKELGLQTEKVKQAVAAVKFKMLHKNESVATENNPRGAGRKPSGKVRVDTTLRLSPELADYLKTLDNRSGWIAEQLEQAYKKNKQTIN